MFIYPHISALSYQVGDLYSTTIPMVKSSVIRAPCWKITLKLDRPQNPCGGCGMVQVLRTCWYLMVDWWFRIWKRRELDLANIGDCPLVMTHSLLLEMAIEIVDYPLKMMIFYSYVSLPEGIVTHESGIPINQPPEGYGMARLEVILLLEPVQALRTCHATHGILVVLVVFGAPGSTPHQYAHICTCVYIVYI